MVKDEKMENEVSKWLEDQPEEVFEALKRFRANLEIQDQIEKGVKSVDTNKGGLEDIFIGLTGTVVKPVVTIDKDGKATPTKKTYLLNVSTQGGWNKDFIFAQAEKIRIQAEIDEDNKKGGEK